MSTAQTKLGLGNWSNVKGVGGGVYERVIDFGPGYRIYLGKDGDKVVTLLAGGTKKRLDTDIISAKERWRITSSPRNRGNETWRSQEISSKP